MDFPKPSTYTPFLRRFTNERKREFDETRAVYDWVKHHQDRFTETIDSVCAPIYRRFYEYPEPVAVELAMAARELLEHERYLWELPPPEFERMSMTEFVEYRNFLHTKQYFFMNQQPVLSLLQDTIADTFAAVADELPELEGPSPFTIPLANAIPAPKQLIERTYRTFLSQKFAEKGLFVDLSNQLIENLYEANGRSVSDGSTKPLRHSGDSALPVDQAVGTFLGRTPLAGIFAAPVPLKLTPTDRMNHVMLVGGPDSGKTSLIETLFLHDAASSAEPSIVLIDPHSDMIQRILQADLGLTDRIIYIHPKDAPGFNPFALNRDRMQGYDEHTKEQVMAGVVQTFGYLFSGLAGGSGELTTKQQILFSYSAQLLLSFPEVEGLARNATILDLLNLLGCSKAHEMEEYRKAIDKLPPIPRNFFERDFLSATFGGTKEELRYRLQGIIATPAMTRLFTAEETTVDVFSALNSGKIILVDTDKGYLKDGSAAFGKLFISIVLQSILERTAIPKELRRDTYLIVDESSDFFSNNVDDLLTEVRKFRCGCLFAFQLLSQASVQLRASLLSATGIKFAANLSAHDARVMAAEMRTSPEAILDQQRLHFSTFIRHVTPNAVSIPITPGRIENGPKISDRAYEEFITRNRERVSYKKAQSRPEPSSPQSRDEDISTKW
jgi:hypothetical protein